MDTYWGPDFDALARTDPEIAAVVLGELFGADHANVQPHSGASANLAAYAALLRPAGSAALAEVAEQVSALVGKYPAYPR